MMATYQKDTGANMKGLPTGQIWDNLRFKRNDR